MKNNNGGRGCGTLVIVAVLLILAAGFLLRQFSTGYAEGGGEMDVRLFSDEISASSDDGIAIAGDNNKIGDINNTVGEPSVANTTAGSVGKLIAIAVFLVCCLAIILRMGPKDEYY